MESVISPCSKPLGNAMPSATQRVPYVLAWFDWLLTFDLLRKNTNGKNMGITEHCEFFKLVI